MNESLGHEFEWEDFTKINLIDFIEYIADKVAQSSQKTYCAMIKSVLNTYSEEINIPCRNYNDILSVRNVKSSNTWLTEEELLKLIEYIPLSELEKQVRNQFIIGAYTGCRHSDFVRLDLTNISNGYLCYVSQKTKTLASVPVKPIVVQYLAGEEEGVSNEKLEGVPVKNRSTPSCEKFKIYSDVTFNRAIREICRKCGITKQIKLFQAGKEEIGEKWEFITSHTARRSFATNLYLRDCDLYSISKMMGHSSIEMTERYICCGLKAQSQKVLEYFK